MLRDTAIAYIARRLGNRSDLAAAILDEMQLVQETLENEDYHPHFLLSDVTDLTLTSGTDFVSFPTDYLAEYEEGALWYYDATASTPYTQLEKRDLDEIKNANLTAGTPQYYALGNGGFYIGPVADADYSLKIIFYQRDTALTTNIENNWLLYTPRLIIARTGLEMATYIQNERMMQFFGSMYSDAYDKFIKTEENRKHVNRDYRMEFK